MMQLKRHSFIEAWANIFVGYGINILANFLLFPLFGWHITLKQNITIGIFYTFISLARSYCLRRVFNYITTTTPQISINSLSFKQAVKFIFIHEQRRHQQDIDCINKDLLALKDVQLPSDVEELAGQIRFEV